ncbi:MAG TPA: hypothetical protein VHE83_15615 [Mycobacteriales bacterium]|nr:hypothetical protein [Mycobacteriales bacterium]
MATPKGPRSSGPKGPSKFDRVRPRTVSEPTEAVHPERADAEGRRALFSTEEPVPAAGSVSVTCSRCHATSVLGPVHAIKAAIPSIHLPIVKRSNPSFMRCPACKRFTWVKLAVRL